MSSNNEEEAVKIEFTGSHFKFSVPVSAGKIGVYGAIELLKEEASKYFFAREREERLKKQVISVPGGRVIQ